MANHNDVSTTRSADALVIPTSVLRWVNPASHDMLRDDCCARDWAAALARTDSENSISLYIDMLSAGLIPAEDECDAAAIAISGGDMPYSERTNLYGLLDRFQRKGLRVFDSIAARTAFAELPEEIDVHRGTVQAEAESAEYGICWTLDRGKAYWFARHHGRFRNLDSPPVVLSAKVYRDAVCGALWERREKELLVLPATLRSVQFEAV